jgi:hypothetical protein
MTKDRTDRSFSKRIAGFRKAFKDRFFLRFHMSLILVGVTFSGLIVSKLLLETGIRSMIIRYSIAVAISYLLFFGLIKLWLLYLRRSSKVVSSGKESDIPGFFDLTTPSSSSAGSIVSQGGEFGGAGASGDWVDSPSGAGIVLVSDAPQSGLASKGSVIGDIDIGDGGIVLIVLGVLLALIFGVGIYLVYAAPAILSEAAVQVMLASSLVKGSKTMDNSDWVGSIFKATWVPFAVVMILSIAIAWISAHYCPGAAKLSDVFRTLWH